MRRCTASLRRDYVGAHVLLDRKRRPRVCAVWHLARMAASPELFRIQEVASLHSWWQWPFGIGNVIVLTSDSNNPHRRLPGMREAEQLRG